MRTDPFTLLQNEIERYLHAAPCFQQAMGPAIKNFEAFNRKRGRTIDVSSEGDQPGIVLDPTGGLSNINANSNYVTFDYGLNLIVSTGDQRIVTVLHPIMWAAFCAVATGLHSSAITALNWRNSNGFVKSFRVDSAATGESDPALNRGIKGWTAVCALNFMLGFQKVDIAAFVTGD